MKKTYIGVVAVFVIVIVLLSGLLLTGYNFSPKPKTPTAYVGIAYCGDNVAQGKQLIDKVKGYTNLFVLQSGLLQRDLASVNELGDYAVAAGMYFLPYFGVLIQESFSVWLESAKAKWGDHLLGVYYGDEPGGKMLDDYVEYEDVATGDSITKTKYGDIVVKKPDGIVINYQLDGNILLSEPAPANSGSDINSEALFYANGTVKVIRSVPNGFSYQTYQQLQNIRPFKDIDETAQRFCARDKDNIEFLKNLTKVFTSDYGLYWFDYLAGYDVVLGQLGWNLSVTQQLSLMRGAANTQQKDWGVFITWKYQTPPYLDNGTEIFNQLKTSYECGAKYFVSFNYYDSEAGTYGTMQDEHFQALNLFWHDVVENSQVTQGSLKAEFAVVFPKNYGWGTRWAEDKVWGIFKADEETQRIWELMQATLKEHGLKVDIVFSDSEFPAATRYQNIYSIE
ncbi:MAG: hypothetical protein NWE95_08275 [Candidatus Bathyarchaeota archaeon]|nr:hypothetical protein [Candidatus Bathyarchaeota archaeon]